MNSTVSLEVKYDPEQGYFTVTVLHYKEDGLGSTGMITREDQLKDWIHECADELYDLALEMRGSYGSNDD